MEQWRGNLTDFAALAPAFAGYGVGNNLGIWMQGVMLRRAEKREEELKEQLEQERQRAAEERQRDAEERQVLERILAAIESNSKSIERLSKSIRGRRRRRRRV